MQYRGPDVGAALPLFNHDAGAASEWVRRPVTADWPVWIDERGLSRHAFDGEHVAAGSREPGPGDTREKHSRQARREDVKEPVAAGHAFGKRAPFLLAAGWDSARRAGYGFRFETDRVFEHSVGNSMHEAGVPAVAQDYYA